MKNMTQEETTLATAKRPATPAGQAVSTQAAPFAGPAGPASPQGPAHQPSARGRYLLSRVSKRLDGGQVTGPSSLPLAMPFAFGRR